MKFYVNCDIIKVLMVNPFCVKGEKMSIIMLMMQCVNWFFANYWAIAILLFVIGGFAFHEDSKLSGMICILVAFLVLFQGHI